MKTKIFEDERGSLIPIEFFDLPFEPKRIFIVKNVPVNSVRGNHAHLETKQIIFCLKGEVEVVLNDSCNEKKIFLKENESVFIPEMIWDSQKFLTSDCQLLVLCSTTYNLDDYIFEFDNFKKLKNEKNFSNGG